MTAIAQALAQPAEAMPPGDAPKSVSQEFMDRVRSETLAYIQETGKSQTEIAKAAGASSTMLSQFLNDKYPAFGANIAKRLAAYLALEERRRSAPRDATWVDTRASREVLTILAQCHELKDFGMIYVAAGIGKTRAAERYRDGDPGVPDSGHPDCILLRVVDTTRQKRPFLKALAREEQVKAPKSGSSDDIFEAIVARLRNSGRMLIVDEAQKLDFRALEMIRDLHDLAHIGIVLMGDELIYQMFQEGRTKAQYERLVSRLGIRRCLRPGPPRKDVEAVARQYIDGADSECIAYLHAKAAGVGGYRAVTKHCRLAFRMAAADGGRGVTIDDLKQASELLG